MSTFSFPIPKRHFDKKTKNIYSIYIFKVAMFLKTGVDIYTYISLVNFPPRTKICGNGLFNP